jgi:hypothetical protein
MPGHMCHMRQVTLLIQILAVHEGQQMPEQRRDRQRPRVTLPVVRRSVLLGTMPVNLAQYAQGVRGRPG